MDAISYHTTIQKLEKQLERKRKHNICTMIGLLVCLFGMVVMIVQRPVDLSGPYKELEHKVAMQDSLIKDQQTMLEEQLGTINTLRLKNIDVEKTLDQASNTLQAAEAALDACELKEQRRETPAPIVIERLN